MRTLIKLTAVAAVALALAPALAPETAAGQFVRAAFGDVSRFCERQPDACATGARALAEAGRFIAEQVQKLGAAEQALTEEDRALRPASGAGATFAAAATNPRPPMRP